jgi:hypothetical protein
VKLIAYLSLVMRFRLSETVTLISLYFFILCGGDNFTFALVLNPYPKIIFERNAMVIFIRKISKGKIFPVHALRAASITTCMYGIGNRPCAFDVYCVPFCLCFSVKDVVSITH